MGSPHWHAYKTDTPPLTHTHTHTHKSVDSAGWKTRNREKPHPPKGRFASRYPRLIPILCPRVYAMCSAYVQLLGEVKVSHGTILQKERDGCTEPRDLLACVCFVCFKSLFDCFKCALRWSLTCEMYTPNTHALTLLYGYIYVSNEIYIYIYYKPIFNKHQEKKRNLCKTSSPPKNKIT